MESKGHSVVINGKKVFYWEQNPDKSETIIILHGFPGSHAGLADLAKTFGEYRVIVPDLPGCGQSEPLEQRHTLEHYSTWIADLMEYISLDQAVVIGYSFGSRVTLFFGAHYPKKAKSIILMNPVLKVDGLIAYCLALHCNIAKLLPEYLRHKWLYNGIYHRVSHAIVFKSPDMERRRQILKQGSLEAKEIDHRVAMEIFDEFYHSDLIKIGQHVVIKSLVIAGSSDKIVSPYSIKKLAENLPGASVRMVEDSGHLFPLEDPAAVSDIIKSWLEVNI
ncbi:alpha/beta hydrolase [Candidatus Parcubacteria bacterium]|nr:alpha/beta hydrolase [Candidatus Parcubacteria bacterium]